MHYYCFLLIISICTFMYLRVDGYNNELSDKVIYLDAGHGGVDSGATYKDIAEKDINLEFCYILMTKLENKGAKVYMTRYEDYDLAHFNAYFRKRSDLYNRASLINNSDADIYISIHLNSTNSSKWNGTQIFYDDINKNNIKLANTLKDNLNIKRKVLKLDNQYMYSRIKKEGVLIELGFLSNSHDRSILTSDKGKEDLADKITKGIISYLTN